MRGAGSIATVSWSTIARDLRAIGVAVRREARQARDGGLRTRALTMIAVSSLSGAAASITPALIGGAIDALTDGHAHADASERARGLGAIATLARSPAAAVALALAGTSVAVALTIASVELEKSLSARVAAALRVAMMRAALATASADRDAYGGPSPGKASGVERLRHAILASAPAVATGIVSMVVGLPSIAIGVGLVAYDFIDSRAGLAFAGGVALFLAVRVLARNNPGRVAAAQKKAHEADAEAAAHVGEGLARAEDVRLLGGGAAVIEELARATTAVADAQARFARILASSSAVKSAASAVAPLLVVVALVTMRGGDAAPAPGEIAKLVLLVPILLARLERLDAIREGLVHQSPMIDATARVLALSPKPARAADVLTLAAESVRGEIAFDAVRFAHAGKPVLADISFTVPAGALVGICGKSGSGKSTLLRLLLRASDPDAGAVRLDGTDLRAIDPAALPRIFGALGQQSALFERSLRENFAFGLEAAPTDSQIDAALAMVGLEADFGSRGKRGLDYRFRATTGNVSGGELRRLLLARMILRAPRVLLLDEPEAALPGGDAEAILKRVAEVARGRTCLVVTHAPHLLPSSFNVVIDEGRVAGIGPHAKLLETCAIYRELQAQALRETA